MHYCRLIGSHGKIVSSAPAYQRDNPEYNLIACGWRYYTLPLSHEEIVDLKNRYIKIGAWTIKEKEQYDFFKKEDIDFIFANGLFEEDK